MEKTIQKFIDNKNKKGGASLVDHVTSLSEVVVKKEDVDYEKVSW